jgi:hypothetical protein
MQSFVGLPYELNLLIFLFSGQPLHQSNLLQDIAHVNTMHDIYIHLVSNHRLFSKVRFAKMSKIERCSQIFFAKENFFQSYVQDYGSFYLYEWEDLVLK